MPEKVFWWQVYAVYWPEKASKWHLQATKHGFKQRSDKDGGEIGRAQAVQAQACNIEPSVHMNPVLLKPNSDTGAQVILQGRAISNMEATGYHDYKKSRDEYGDRFIRPTFC